MSNATPPDPDPAAGRPGSTGATGGGDRSKPGSSPGSKPGSSSGGAPPPASSPRGPKGSSGATGADATAGATDDAKPSVPFTQQLGRVTIVVLAALFGVFAVANSQRVDFSWVFGETLVVEGPTGEVSGGVPLIVLLIIAFVAGALITFLTELYVGRGRRARKATHERADQGSDGGQGKQGKQGRKGGKGG